MTSVATPRMMPSRSCLTGTVEPVAAGTVALRRHPSGAIGVATVQPGGEVTATALVGPAALDSLLGLLADAAGSGALGWVHVDGARSSRLSLYVSLALGLPQRFDHTRPEQPFDDTVTPGQPSIGVYAARGGLSPLLAAAHQALTTALLAQVDLAREESLALGPVVIDHPGARRSPGSLWVAADASTSRSTGASAGAWVTDRGEHRTFVTRQPGGGRSRNNAGEIGAVVSAILQNTSPRQPLEVLTDSQRALTLVRLALESGVVEEGSPQERRALHGLTSRAHVAGEVRLHWVRGHSGHPLQEIADRLAVLARRDHIAGVPAREHSERAAAVVAETLAGDQQMAA